MPDQYPELIDPPLLAAIRGFRATSVDGYTRLLRRRSQHRETLRRFFERYDLLLTPTTPCVAWNIERGLPPGHENAIVWSYFTYLFNLTEQPAGSLPCGLSPEGLPIGLQFVVPLCREDRLVGAMLAAEAALRSLVHCRSTPVLSDWSLRRALSVSPIVSADQIVAQSDRF